ncbi:urease accessory protein UreD [uncultured Hoeflea sp.]|uniref:urease accessory protein UreD n=1 Tax=uncultured Hoeflea sp. TaxID=538666 RepID=UPI00261D5FBF|nr:urease accessory protein UreD [uncultured Hoeflea sp.]
MIGRTDFQVLMTAQFPPPTVLTPQRTQGTGRLSAKCRDGEHRLDRLYQAGAARLRLPRVARSSPLEAVMINTAGGLTGGDQMDWRFETGPGAHLSLTTQACERIYRAQGESRAHVSLRLALGENSSLAWLPQETILFDRARLDRSIEVDMAANARLLMVEPVVFGRVAMQEIVTTGLFRDQWRIRHNGRLLHAEAARLGPDIANTLDCAASTGGGLAVATVVMVAPEAEARLDAARQIIGRSGGASYLSPGAAGSGKLLARLVTSDSYALRKVLGPLIRLLNPDGGLPKVWTT